MKITLETYEAFYLDFLEGTISKENEHELFAFLQENPALQLEDENSLPTLTNLNETFDFEKKENLKKNDTTSSANLSESTDFDIDNLIIGEIEGTNNLQESQLIQGLIANNTHVAKDFLLYQNTRLVANPDELYIGKTALKKRETIVLWPWLSAAAASIIVILSISYYNNQNTESIAKKNEPKKENVVPNNVNKSENSNEKLASNMQNDSLENKKNKNQERGNSQKDINSTKDLNKLTKNNDNQITKNNNSNQKINSPAQEINLKNNINVIAYDKNEVQASEITPEKGLNNGSSSNINASNTNTTASTFQSSSTSSSYKNVAFDEMKNPISAITTRAENILGTPIDYRTSKSTKTKSGGFRVKIGKFEVSHKTHNKG